MTRLDGKIAFISGAAIGAAAVRATATIFLAADDSGFMTGSILVVDGGSTAR